MSENTISKQQIRDARLVQEDQAVLSSIEEILEDVRNGKPVIIVDDEDRENEGDLVIAASKAAAENINFMAREGRGLICLPMEEAIVDRLGLQLMGRGNNSRHRTAFTVSIEAREGVTTGISAADRAKTIRTAIDPDSGPNDIATPGHVFPLLAREGGVLVRAGHTEAAVDLARMAGLTPAGVICEIMNDDGTMARLNDLVAFSQKHNLKIGTIADLIAYRRRTECLVKRIHEGTLESRFGGTFKLIVYANTLEYAEHIVLVKGDVTSAKDPVLVRMHAVDILGDILGKGSESILHTAMERIAEEECGVIVILREPNPKSLTERLAQQEKIQNEKAKEDTLRDYGIGAQILRDLGIRNMILLSNSPKNVIGLEGYDLHIHGQRALS
ncbi:MAG: 3,4-dihydroxy-2-butanone-4-phosphate synthase [Rhodospirillales bacterium]|nr:3,4-dihydroxy-2-butanone-4-phosphate synthase [Rhodospirillales bacterium]